MAKDGTVSLSVRVEGERKSFRSLTESARGLETALQSNVTQAERLHRSLINWSAAVQGIQSVSRSVGDMVGSLQDLAGRYMDVSKQSALTAQLTGLTGDALASLRDEVRAVANTFGSDYNETLAAANSLAKGFGVSFEDAMKLIKDGFVSGANSNGEFLDTLREYPRYFKEAGLSAEQFIAITANAAQQGIYSDKGVDTIKEGNIRIREMTKATAEALEGIGISSEKVQAQLQAGTMTTFDVMQMVAAKLNELPASASQVGTAIADIFGGPGEDAGLEYIRSLATVELSLDNVKSAMGDTAAEQERLISLSALYTNVQPYVDFASQIGMTAMGVGSLVSSIKALNIQKGLMLAWGKRTAAVTLLLGVNAKKGAAAMRVFSGAMRNATMRATAFRLALQGITRLTAVGTIIGGLVAVISHFTNAANEAKEKAAQLRQEMEDFGREARDTSGLVEQSTVREITALERLYKTATDETKSREERTAAMKELQRQYPTYFSQLSAENTDVKDLTDRYNGLRTSILAVARARAAQSKIEENMGKQIDLEMQIKKQQTKVDELKPAEDIPAATSRLQESLSGAKAFMPASVALGQTSSEQQWERSIKLYEDANAELEKMQTQLQELKDANVELQAMVDGAGATSAPKTAPIASTAAGGNTSGENIPSWVADPKTLKEIEGNISVLRERLQSVSDVTEAAGINQQISGLQAMADAIRQAGKAADDAADSYTPKALEQLNTLGELQQALAYYQEQQRQQGKEQAVQTQATIDAIQAEINKRNELLTLPALQAQSVELGELGEAELKVRLQTVGLDGVRKNIELLQAMLTTATEVQAGEIRTLITQWENYRGVLAATTQQGPTASENISAISKAMSGMSDTLKGAAQQWLQWGANLLSAIAQAIPAIAALTAAKEIESGANAKAAVTGAASSVASIPIVGPALAIAAAASVIAALLAIPKFAKGGIAYGPTLGVFGEYPGAANNPEVVAPLDRLRSMLTEPAAATAGQVEFKIQGRTLVGVLNKELNISARS